METAPAHIKEPAMYSNTPPMSTGRLPYRSARNPKTRVPAVWPDGAVRPGGAVRAGRRVLLLGCVLLLGRVPLGGRILLDVVVEIVVVVAALGAARGRAAQDQGRGDDQTAM